MGVDLLPRLPGQASEAVLLVAGNALQVAFQPPIEAGLVVESQLAVEVPNLPDRVPLQILEAHEGHVFGRQLGRLSIECRL